MYQNGVNKTIFFNCKNEASVANEIVKVFILIMITDNLKAEWLTRYKQVSAISSTLGL